MWHLKHDTWQVTFWRNLLSKLQLPSSYGLWVRGDMWHLKCDPWHLTPDMWHVTYDTCHVTHRRWWTLCKTFRSLALKWIYGQNNKILKCFFLNRAMILLIQFWLLLLYVKLFYLPFVFFENLKQYVAVLSCPKLDPTQSFQELLYLLDKGYASVTAPKKQFKDWSQVLGQNFPILRNFCQMSIMHISVEKYVE